ncbi:universal stress protein [Kitasatospora sp. NPDC097643]|uniref:universal stress protein n=1 Tax=Kitasatospora sp. NPDC097643 TaxID=3157230 RepID=UPI00331ED424
MTTRQILTGLDGSPESEAAADWAAREAAARGVGLRLVHVWPWLAVGAVAEAGTPCPGGLQPAAVEALAGTAERLRSAYPGLAVETDLIGADPVDGLLRASAGAELLVVGSRGIGGFAGLVVGSVGLAVAARSAVPAVLVRARHAATGEGGVGRADGAVLLGVDVHQPADALLDFAFAEAALRDVPLRAVHSWQLTPVGVYGGVVPPPVDPVGQEGAARAALEEALAPWRAKYPGVAVVTELRFDGAAWSLINSATEQDVSLVVVGRRERPLPVGPRLGAVAHAVLHHSPAPVAVVPHP